MRDMWYAVYAVAVPCALLLGWRLGRKGEPPSAAYLTFAIFAGVVLLYVLIDTGRVPDLPGLRLGNIVYRFEQVEEQVRGLQSTVVGWDTETFPRGTYEVAPAPGDTGRPFRLKFALKHRAVSDSVWVFENDVPIAPTRFDVDGNTVIVRSPVDPVHGHDDGEYVIRYLRQPTATGAGIGGATATPSVQ